MIRILTYSNAGNLFANAGQAFVERALLDALAATGRVQLHLVLLGDRRDAARVEQAYAAHVASGAIAIEWSPQGLRRHHAEGMTGLMEHGIPDPGLVNRIPRVVHLHSLELDALARCGLGHSARKWDRTTPYVILAPSESTAARARWIQARACRGESRLPPVLVLPHGVAFAAAASGDRARGRRRLGVAEPTRLILSLNRLSSKKLDYRQLLAAFAAVRARHPELVLVLAGGAAPDDRDTVAALPRWARALGVEDCVRVLEHVEERDKPDVLAAADVMVSTAVNPQESFGLVLLEGAAAGLPIVATDWNGYRETLPRDYQRWSVATVGSPALARRLDWCGGDASLSRASTAEFDGLVAALHDALASPPQGLPELGRRWARERDWTSVARALLALWDEIAAGRASFHADPPALEVDSPISGLATRELVGSARLYATGRAPALALDELADGRPLPPRAVAEVLQLCANGASLAAVRGALEVEPEDADDMVLELLRFGALALERHVA
jgi:glycosyltransferase involved in cell wall biosynthesis